MRTVSRNWGAIVLERASWERAIARAMPGVSAQIPNERLNRARHVAAGAVEAAAAGQDRVGPQAHGFAIGE